MEQSTVFVSYSSKNIEVANYIVSRLQKLNISYWKAPEMIPAGSSYAKEIPRAIQNCQIVLLVLSKASQESIWVEKEIDSAICNRKVIIPFQIEEMELNDTFRFYLNNVQTVMYYQDKEEAFKMLRAKLAPVATEEEFRKDTEPQAHIVELNKVTGSRRKSGDVNALRTNRIPVVCKFCGCKELEHTSLGIYKCIRCNGENYDDYQTIRKYIERKGRASYIEIERETGIPRRIIDNCLKEGYLFEGKNRSF